jgi:hypothetical protein
MKLKKKLSIKNKPKNNLNQPELTYQTQDLDHEIMIIL